MISKYRLAYAMMLLAFWPSVTIGFISEEILPFLNPIRPLVMGASDMLVALMGLMLMRDRSDRIVFWSLLFITVLSAMLNHSGIGMMLNGLRDFIGIVLVIPCWRYILRSPYRSEFIRKIDRQLFIFLIVQAVCLTEQFIRYGANDHGGGSLGNNASGIISTAIYYVSFYLMTRRWDSSLSFGQNLWKNRILIFLLYPTFLNETKVSFIYLILYFPLLYEIDRNYLLKMARIVPAVVILMIAAVPVYLFVTGQSMNKIFTEEAMTEYIAGGDNLDEYLDNSQRAQDDPDMEIENAWIVDIPRMAKIGMMPMMLRHEHGGLLLGAGMGQFKGGSVVAATAFATEYEWAMRGTRPFLFFLVIQLGLVGLAWYIMTMILQIDFPHNYFKPLGLNVKLYFLAMMLLMLLYNESPRSMQLCWLMYYALAITTTRPSQDSPHEPDEEAIAIQQPTP